MTHDDSHEMYREMLAAVKSVLESGKPWQPLPPDPENLAWRGYTQNDSSWNIIVATDGQHSAGAATYFGPKGHAIIRIPDDKAAQIVAVIIAHNN
jgi:hypothetical protein